MPFADYLGGLRYIGEVARRTLSDIVGSWRGNPGSGTDGATKPWGRLDFAMREAGKYSNLFTASKEDVEFYAIEVRTCGSKSRSGVHARMSENRVPDTRTT
jgi:hypothetical protein